MFGFKILWIIWTLCLDLKGCRAATHTRLISLFSFLFFITCFHWHIQHPNSATIEFQIEFPADVYPKPEKPVKGRLLINICLPQLRCTSFFVLVSLFCIFSICHCTSWLIHSSVCPASPVWQDGEGSASSIPAIWRIHKQSANTNISRRGENKHIHCHSLPGNTACWFYQCKCSQLQ